jgi:hypothetical protein
MWRFLMCVLLIAQASAAPRPSIVAKASEPPRRNFWIVYYDDAFLFAARNFGDSRDAGGSTEPGLFVHSRQRSRWIRILEISTAGGRFGKSSSNDPEAQKKLRPASVGWDFTPYATRDYIEQPLRTSGSIAFPERVEYRPERGTYELRYLTSWGVPSAEMVLYTSRSDLLGAFATLVPAASVER